jgi:uncharacterized protein
VRIELASLEDGKRSFTHSYAEGELELELDLGDASIRLVEPPQVTGEVRQEMRAVEVRGKVNARVEVECDRCLQPIDLPVASKFKLEYVTADNFQSLDEAELAVEDLDQTVFDGESIDVDSLVAEELLLVVPDHRLCKPDCRGICPACGADRNSTECGCDTKEVDPRWAGLKSLVNRES